MSSDVYEVKPVEEKKDVEEIEYYRPTFWKRIFSILFDLLICFFISFSIFNLSKYIANNYTSLKEDALKLDEIRLESSLFVKDLDRVTDIVTYYNNSTDISYGAQELDLSARIDRFFTFLLDNAGQSAYEEALKYYDDFIIQMQILQSQGTGTYYIDEEEKVINIRNAKRSLYLCMNSIYALEAIRFYVSFACSFAFGERELLDANARIIKLISRDEALHMAGTQTIMNLWRRGDDDPEMGEISEEMRDYGEKIFLDTMQQEIEWTDYLFKDGPMLGLNREVLIDYLKYISANRMSAVGFKTEFDFPEKNPLPWMNNWLNSDNVQVAPQEVEMTSYLIGQVDAHLNPGEFSEFEEEI